MSILCDAACVDEIIRGSAGCYTPKRGGIKYFVAMTCDQSFTDITDQLEWDAMITAKKIRLSPELEAELAAATHTTDVINTCVQTMAYLGSEIPLNFSSGDYSTDGAEYTAAEFWDYLLKNYQNLRFGFFDCDGQFYGMTTLPDGTFQMLKASLQVADVRPLGSKTRAKFEGTLTFDNFGLILPQTIPNGVLPALEAAANVA